MGLLTAIFVACGVSWSGAAAAEEPKQPPAQGRPGDGAKQKPAAEAKLQLLVIHATRSGKKQERPKVDPRIGSLPELEREPLSLYDTFTLLLDESSPATKGAKHATTLPNRRVVVTELKDVLPDGSVRLNASIHHPQGKSFLPLLEVRARPGQSFIVAGQSHDKGMLVLVFRVVSPAS